MCEYCEGISSPISKPLRIQKMTKNFKNNIVYFGFTIEENQLHMFLKRDWDNQKETLLKRKISYCPMCR